MKTVHESRGDETSAGRRHVSSRAPEERRAVISAVSSIREGCWCTHRHSLARVLAIDEKEIENVLHAMSRFVFVVAVQGFLVFEKSAHLSRELIHLFHVGAHDLFGTLLVGWLDRSDGQLGVGRVLTSGKYCIDTRRRSVVRLIRSRVVAAPVRLTRFEGKRSSEAVQCGWRQRGREGVERLIEIRLCDVP